MTHQGLFPANIAFLCLVLCLLFLFFIVGFLGWLLFRTLCLLRLHGSYECLKV